MELKIGHKETRLILAGFYFNNHEQRSSDMELFNLVSCSAVQLYLGLCKLFSEVCHVRAVHINVTVQLYS